MKVHAYEDGYHNMLIHMQVFADDKTSRDPIHVPRSLIWNLPRRTVFFGTSVSTIFKGIFHLVVYWQRIKAN